MSACSAASASATFWNATSTTLRYCSIDWFSVSAEWEAEGMKLTKADLQRLASATGRFVKLPDSGWVELDTAAVQRGLALMDANRGEVWAKLDAGTEAYYRAVNRTAVRFERILGNLLLTARVRPIIIQTLLLRLHGELMPPDEFSAYCDRLRALVRDGAQLREIHLYTIARPTPEPFCAKLTRAELETFAQTVRAETGQKVLTFD